MIGIVPGFFYLQVHLSVQVDQVLLRIDRLRELNLHEEGSQIAVVAGYNEGDEGQPTDGEGHREGGLPFPALDSWSWS